MPQAKIPVDLILSKMAEDTEKAQTRARKASEVLLGDLGDPLDRLDHQVAALFLLPAGVGHLLGHRVHGLHRAVDLGGALGLLLGRRRHLAHVGL